MKYAIIKRIINKSALQHSTRQISNHGAFSLGIDAILSNRAVSG